MLGNLADDDSAWVTLVNRYGLSDAEEERLKAYLADLELYYDVLDLQELTKHYKSKEYAEFKKTYKKP